MVCDYHPTSRLIKQFRTILSTCSAHNRKLNAESLSPTLENLSASKKGQEYTKCKMSCLGRWRTERQTYRKSLATRDWGRAGRRAAKLEEPGARQPKPIPEAIVAF